MKLHIFATFEGLPYHPFGRALFAEFIKRSNQWRVTTEQRQAGIFLFAESYGDEFLGPEYTGIRCSLVQDIPYLSSFGDCLVYLDLSGGYSKTGDGGATGFTDKDMAGLSALSRLRILNLSHLKVGDIGLSHLVRSVTYGSSGPTMLEYLNLSGTEVTDVGIAKIFHGKNQKSLVFTRLLGIDLTDSNAHDEVMEALFKNHRVPWKRLENRLTLFPESSTSKTTKDGYSDCYIESGSGLNPMQKWIDCFMDRSFKIKFGQRPDLSLTGKDAWGLSECLALAKLGQVYFHPISEQSSGYQQEFMTSLNVSAGWKSRSKKSRYVRDFKDTLLKAAQETQSLQQQTELEHMYNLKMFQSVLGSIRETAGSIVQLKPKKKTTSGTMQRLAFVRNKIDVDDLLTRLELGDDTTEPTLTVSERSKKISVSSNTANTTKAKVRNRHSRVSASTTPAIYPFPPQEHKDLLDPRAPVLHSGSFYKHSKTSTPLPFVKQEESITSITNAASDKSHIPERRRIFDAHSKYHPPPFVKPAAEQITSNIFITDASFKDKINPAPAKLQPLHLHTKTKPKLSSSAMMERWVSQAKQSKQPKQSSPQVPSSNNNVFIASDKGQGSATISSSGSVIREFHFTDKSNDTVNLDRWIRSGPVVRGVKCSNDRSEFGYDREEERPRKVIRFDPKNELFADGDVDVECQHND
ncbi:hypothetical protein BGZ46_000308 [Entomortierella lignicola]|nr:hypothetical protein BGZ46_000308 [Entomortierella lignicola]